jgi:hypothetical protein
MMDRSLLRWTRFAASSASGPSNASRLMTWSRSTLTMSPNRRGVSRNRRGVPRNLRGVPRKRRGVPRRRRGVLRNGWIDSQGDAQLARPRGEIP